MFGLFSTDLPIGKRLWLTIIVLVIAGSLATSSLARVNQDPVSFTIELLVFYGYAALIESLLTALCVLIPLMIVEAVVRSHVIKEAFFKEMDINNSWATRVGVVLSPIIFVIAVVKVAPGFGSASSRQLGILGLVLYLIATLLVDIRSLGSEYYSYLTVINMGNNVLKAQLIKSDKLKEFMVEADWMRTLAYLTDNGWDLVESSFLGVFCKCWVWKISGGDSLSLLL